jgi:hypothetical protein
MEPFATRLGHSKTIFHSNGFWIAGLRAQAVPRLPGYVTAYARGSDTLLLAAGS